MTRQAALFWPAAKLPVSTEMATANDRRARTPRRARSGRSTVLRVEPEQWTDGVRGAGDTAAPGEMALPVPVRIA